VNLFTFVKVWNWRLVRRIIELIAALDFDFLLFDERVEYVRIILHCFPCVNRNIAIKNFQLSSSGYNNTCKILSMFIPLRCASITILRVLWGTTMRSKNILGLLGRSSSLRPFNIWPTLIYPLSMNLAAVTIS
jgi:hypothetical protein